MFLLVNKFLTILKIKYLYRFCDITPRRILSYLLVVLHCHPSDTSPDAARGLTWTWSVCRSPVLGLLASAWFRPQPTIPHWAGRHTDLCIKISIQICLTNFILLIFLILQSSLKLLMRIVSLISKEIDIKSLIRFGGDSNLNPPTPWADIYYRASGVVYLASKGCL